MDPQPRRDMALPPYHPACWRSACALSWRSR